MPARCGGGRAWYHRCDSAGRVRKSINITRRHIKEAAMSQTNTKSNALTVRSAVRAGFSRVDQPDPQNRKPRSKRTRRLALAQFGVNEQGMPTFTRA